VRGEQSLRFFSEFLAQNEQREAHDSDAELYDTFTAVQSGKKITDAESVFAGRSNERSPDARWWRGPNRSRRDDTDYQETKCKQAGINTAASAR
jgi:hypothetical protein